MATARPLFNSSATKVLPPTSPLRTPRSNFNRLATYLIVLPSRTITLNDCKLDGIVLVACTGSKACSRAVPSARNAVLTAMGSRRNLP